MTALDFIGIFYQKNFLSLEETNERALLGLPTELFSTFLPRRIRSCSKVAHLSRSLESKRSGPFAGGKMVRHILMRDFLAPHVRNKTARSLYH
jgi:hypothetical protein